MTILINSADLQAEADFAADFFGPGWKDRPAHRRICEALVDAQAAVAAYEGAARRDYSRKVSEMAERICAPDVYRKRGII